jgi:hypothetical protein
MAVRIIAIILDIICLIYVVARLVADIDDYYFDTAGFYLLLCLCFIVNLIALRKRKKARACQKNKERNERQAQD